MSRASDIVAREIDRLNELQQRVLEVFLVNGRNGLTNVELHAMAPSADRRMRELRKKGYDIRKERMNDRGLVRYWLVTDGDSQDVWPRKVEGDGVAAVAQRTSAQPMEQPRQGDPARPSGQLDLFPRPAEYPR